MELDLDTLKAHANRIVLALGRESRGYPACEVNVELAKRLGVDEKEVRRLLDPHYGSKLPRIARAVEALGKRLVIGLEAA